MMHDDDTNFKKNIKKDEPFAYKPLTDYNWRPGFQKIPTEELREAEVEKKQLKLSEEIESKKHPFYPKMPDPKTRKEQS